MLCTLRDVQVIREAHQRGEIARIATEERPDIVFAGSDLPDLPIVPLVQELCEISPTSRVVVVGGPLDSADRAYLAGLGVCGVLLWRDVTERTVRIIIEAVCANLYVTSTIAADLSTRPSRGWADGMGNGAVAYRRRAQPCMHR